MKTVYKITYKKEFKVRQRGFAFNLIGTSKCNPYNAEYRVSLHPEKAQTLSMTLQSLNPSILSQ